MFACVLLVTSWITHDLNCFSEIQIISLFQMLMPVFFGRVFGAHALTANEDTVSYE